MRRTVVWCQEFFEGLEVLAILAKEKSYAVLLDIGLPDLDNDDVARQI